MKDINNKLFEFINNSPSCFHAIESLKSLLNEHGYVELKETINWNLEKNGKYYVTRNNSSIIAFNIGDNINDIHYQISASHSDSPTFKIKEVMNLEGKGGYIKLNTEGYGGMLCAPWFDKPLGIAGRIFVKENNGIKAKFINIDKPMLMIPNVAIHMNRNINDGYAYNKQIDLLPLFGSKECDKDSFMEMLSEYSGVKKDDIVSHDLFLTNLEKPTVWGYKDEFISAPKLDDLQCAFTSFSALVHSVAKDAINVACCFDNEEVGSGTKQGAFSTLLLDTLKRINLSLNKNEEDYYCSIAKSFMISCDNAHAVHPNHPEKTDEKNCCYMNEGIVIKYNANQKYTTDAFSGACMKEICNKANVKYQSFANRSDMMGGSTLGNISNAHVSLNTVDIGIAQLAMHSNYETCGSKDSANMYEALKTFYSSNIIIDDTGFKI